MPLSHLVAAELVAKSFSFHEQNFTDLVDYLLPLTPTNLIAAVDADISNGFKQRQLGLRTNLDSSEVLSNELFFSTVNKLIMQFYESFALTPKEVEHLAIAYFWYLGVTSPDFPISDEEQE